MRRADVAQWVQEVNAHSSAWTSPVEPSGPAILEVEQMWEVDLSSWPSWPGDLEAGNGGSKADIPSSRHPDPEGQPEASKVNLQLRPRAVTADLFMTSLC
jgi:hypothetical protein